MCLGGMDQGRLGMTGGERRGGSKLGRLGRGVEGLPAGTLCVQTQTVISIRGIMHSHGPSAPQHHKAPRAKLSMRTSIRAPNAEVCQGFHR